MLLRARAIETQTYVLAAAQVRSTPKAALLCANWMRSFHNLGAMACPAFALNWWRHKKEGIQAKRRAESLARV